MTGFALLDVAIGVIFAFLTFSLVASSMQEALASIFNWRGRMLRRGLFRLLENETTSKKLVSQTWIAEAAETAEITVEMLNDPTLRSLQGSKSMLGKIFGTASAILAKPWRVFIDAVTFRAFVDEKQSANVDSASRQNRAKIMKDLGRMPSQIPKETFAKSFLNTLYTKFKDEIDAKVDEVRETAASSAEELKAKFDQAIEDAQAAAAKARQEAIDQGKEPPKDDPLTLSDDLLREARSLLTPQREFVETYATNIATNIDKALDGANGLIDKLPMDPALQKKVKAALKSMVISKALKEKFDQVDNLIGGVEDEVTKQIERLESYIEKTTAEIGDWFDQGMDRVTGWYIRRAKNVLFLLGFMMAMIVNFDIIGYGGQLLNDEDLRNRAVAQAEAAVADGNVGGLEVQRKTAEIFAALQVNENRDGEITADELEQNLDRISPDRRIELGIDEPTLTQLDDQTTDDGKNKRDVRLEAVAAKLNDVFKSMVGAAAVDTNEDGGITDDERDAAALAYIENVRSEFGRSVDLLNTQFAGAKIGRTCPVPPRASPVEKAEPSAFMAGLGYVTYTLYLTDIWNFFWEDSLAQCIKQSWDWQAFISWLLIGFGCTLGGQFWFDMLKNLLKVRTAASGINSDVKKLMGGSQDDNSAGQGGASNPNAQGHQP